MSLGCVGRCDRHVNMPYPKRNVRMFWPWRTKQQDPLQVLQVHCKYSDRTKDHYRLNTVLRGAGKGKLKNKCTVVPYVTSSEASDKPRLLHRTVRLLADHLEKAG